MKLKQREVNKKALSMAASMVEDADFCSLFDDMLEAGETDAEIEHNDTVMQKAQNVAVARIRKLIAA